MESGSLRCAAPKAEKPEGGDGRPRLAVPRGTASPMGLLRIGMAASAKAREARIKDELAVDFSTKRKAR